MSQSIRRIVFKPIQVAWRFISKMLSGFLCVRISSLSLVQRLREFIYSKPLKQDSEFSFWQKRYIEHGKKFRYEYKTMMMAAGNIPDENFFDNKIVADIGCGPCGSIEWIKNARFRIGIDPLTDKYMAFGIERHNMLYLKATAEDIPLPSSYVDIVFSINSLDHVDKPFKAMSEIRRILKPGGYFIGAINLRYFTTINEPHRLSVPLLEKYLFRGWIKEYSSVRSEGEQAGDLSGFFRQDPPAGYKPKFMILCCRYRKPE